VLLKKINDAPAVLYVKGTLGRGDSLAVSIVGSRRCSLYGSEQASRFSYILGSSGFTVVSGMARGIDTAAHKGALSAGGRTIAVQGCGLNKRFPAENEKLFDEIVESGACISSFPLDYEPLAENFPSRNRIIAGSSLAVVVIEAGNRSGSLITARLGLEYNREVMAVPGKIDSPLSSGSNKLIKEGAKLIDCAGDIIEALGLVGQTVKEVVSKAENQIDKNEKQVRAETAKIKLSDYEQSIYANISGEPTHIEDIIVNTGLEIGRINAGLISLRLKGLINHLQGNIYNKR
jgi:DNA processing protein